MPATPPPDIDLEIWDKSLRRHFGAQTVAAFSHALRLFRTILPSTFCCFRERLHRWSALAEEILRKRRQRFRRNGFFHVRDVLPKSRSISPPVRPNTTPSAPA